MEFDEEMTVNNMADSKWHTLESINGYNLAEVASALQKEIRRGNADNAMYWASELFLSGYDGYCWKRLEVIMVEDCDIRNVGLFADIHALRMIAASARKERKDKPFDERESLSLIAAVTRLAEAPKSRVNASATVYHIQMPREATKLREIPDYALDRHTSRGKRKGRGWDYFFAEAAKIKVNGELTNDEGDPYLESVWNWLNTKKKPDTLMKSLFDEEE